MSLLHGFVFSQWKRRMRFNLRTRPDYQTLEEKLCLWLMNLVFAVPSNTKIERLRDFYHVGKHIVLQSQDSSSLVAMEAEWSRADILKLIELLKERLIIDCEHCTRLADTNLISTNNFRPQALLFPNHCFSKLKQ